MKKAKILKDFLRIGDVALESRATTVGTAMKDNAYFPNPTPGQDELNEKIQQFGTALIAAKNRDRLKSSEKNDLRKQLQTVLLNLSYYVTVIAQGDRTILISSGFAVSADVSLPATMPGIQQFAVEQGKESGNVLLKFRKVKTATLYIYYYAVSDAEKTVWQKAEGTKVRKVLSGLQAGIVYTFYVEAHGAKDRKSLSPSITKTVF